MLFHSFMANYMDKITHLLFCGIFLLVCTCQNKGAVKEGVPQQREDSIRVVQADSAITDTTMEAMVQEEEYTHEYTEEDNTSGEDPFAGTPVTERREQHTQFDSTYPSIHIFVALCDNENQGIVKVPASIGNGQKPSTNLYWGCGYGIKTFFKKSAEWKLLKTSTINDTIMERLVFKHASQNYYLVADAYNGKYIAQCISDFLSSSCGRWKDTVHVNDNLTIGCCGNSQLISYIGHDGLMEHILNDRFTNTDGKKRDVIILACVSRTFFSPYLEPANVNPIVWTKQFMAPEAYTIHDAITGYIKKESNQKILERAINAYATYQKCGIKGAKSILVTGGLNEE